MQQQDFKPPAGAKKARRRRGRGDSSGYGSFAGRGMKGQNSRSGGGVRPGFEGGQLPLSKKLPFVRGFTNIFRVEYNVVNVDKLSEFEANSEINPQVLRDTGILRSLNKPVKILGRGEIDIPLTVTADKVSASARQKIEAAGGTVTETR